jgi:hypothetical protein
MQQSGFGDRSNEFLGGPQIVFEMRQYQAVVRQEVAVNVGIGWILCFSRLFNHSERSNVCPSHGTRSFCRRTDFNYHTALQTQWSCTWLVNKAPDDSRGLGLGSEQVARLAACSNDMVRYR